MAAPSTVPVGKGLSESQWETWFQGFVKANPKMPTYTGTNTLAKGKTWDKVYPVLFNAGQKQTPPLTPDQVAEAEIILIQTQAVADGIGATVQFTGTTVVDAGKAGAGTAAQLGKDIPGLNAITSVTGFLSALGNLNLWIRVAKVVAGGVILAIGLAKLTGADKTIGGVAAKAVKVAPLL